MLAPLLLARIEQRYRLLGLRIDTPHLRMLATITPKTSPGQIVQIVCAPLLARHNMLYRKTVWAIRAADIGNIRIDPEPARPELDELKRVDAIETSTDSCFEVLAPDTAF